MENKTNWSRLAFLKAVAGITATMVLNPLPSWAWAIDEIDPRIAALVASTIGIDTHNHIDVPLTKAEMPGPNIDLAGEMKKSGLSAICMTFALDYQKLQNSGEAWERFLNAMSVIDEQLKNNGMKRALNLSDLQKAHKTHKPIAIQSVEGGHFLEGKLERVGIAYERGLRHLTLLHDSDASVPLGDVYTNPPRFGGLTPFGTEVIKECNRLGILVDLAHADRDTIATSLKIAQHPVIISHTGLDTQLGKNEFMAKMMKPRLISKEQAKIVADTGGIIGVWTHLADTPLVYAQNIRALVDVIGVDHVCIGTDTKLTPAYRSAGGFGGAKPQGSLKPEGGGAEKRPEGASNNKPQNGQGGGQNRGRVGERTNEAWQDQKTGFYYAVVDALLKSGFNADEIGKIGGGNFCRMFGEATGKK